MESTNTVHSDLKEETLLNKNNHKAFGGGGIPPTPIAFLFFFGVKKE